MKKIFIIALFFAALPILCQSQDILWQKNLNASAFEFSPNSDYLAVAYGGGVSLRNIQTGDEIRIIKEMKNDGALSLSFSKDGKFLAGVSYQGRVFVWNTETWEEREVDNLLSPLNEVEYSQDGNYIAVAGRKNGMLLYDTKTWQRIDKWNRLPELPKGGGLPEISNVSFRFDNKAMAITSNQANTVILYDIEKKQPIDTLFGESAKYLPGRNELIIIKMINSNGNLIADGLDYYKFDQSIEPEHLNFGVLNYVISSDGNYIVRFGDYPANVDIFDLKNRIKTYTFKYLNDYSYGYATINHTNRYLATISGILFLIDLDNILGVIEPKLIENFNAYPNPTNNNLIINYTLKVPSHIELKLSNLDASQIRLIKSEFQTEGQHSVVNSISDISSGTYFIYLKINEKIYSYKINIVR